MESEDIYKRLSSNFMLCYMCFTLLPQLAPERQIMKLIWSLSEDTAADGDHGDKVAPEGNENNAKVM